MLASVQRASFGIALNRPRETQRSNIDCKELGQDRYCIEINMASRVSIPFTSDTTLQALHDGLMAPAENGVKKVQFYSLTGSRLPLCERVGDQRTFPVLLQINDERIFALNFSTQYKIESRLENEQKIYEEEYYFDFARDIGLNGYQKYSLPYISHKMMHALPPKMELSTADLESSLTTVMRYMSRSTEQHKNERFSDAKSHLDNLEMQVGVTEKQLD